MEDLRLMRLDGGTDWRVMRGQARYTDDPAFELSSPETHDNPIITPHGVTPPGCRLQGES
jgi:hypothetical protein